MVVKFHLSAILSASLRYTQLARQYHSVISNASPRGSKLGTDISRRFSAKILTFRGNSTHTLSRLIASPKLTSKCPNTGMSRRSASNETTRASCLLVCVCTNISLMCVSDLAKVYAESITFYCPEEICVFFLMLSISPPEIRTNIEAIVNMHQNKMKRSTSSDIILFD